MQDTHPKRRDQAERHWKCNGNRDTAALLLLYPASLSLIWNPIILQKGCNSLPYKSSSGEDQTTQGDISNEVFICFQRCNGDFTHR